MRFLNPILLVLGWAVTRLLLVRQSFGRHRWIFGDVHYYFSEILKERSGQVALKEYPEANLWLIRLIDHFAPDSQTSIEYSYVGFILVLDFLFFLLLLRRGHRLASWFWVAFGLVVGPIYLTRLDLIPGLLVGVFAYLLARHQKLAAAFLGAATMMKLWPGVLAAVLVGHFKSLQSWLRIAAFGGTMVVMALITTLTLGFDRLLSPLSYQGERGLQIESVAATPFMVLASTGGGGYRISYAPSKSFEVVGPGVATATQVASLALYAVVLFAAFILLRRLTSLTWRASESVALAVVLTVAMLVTNKVFSPQYIVWLAPIFAVALCFSKSPKLRQAAVLVLVITWLTQLIYPANYTTLMTNDPDFLPTLLLTLRNAAMILLMVLSLQWWRWETRQPLAAVHNPPEAALHGRHREAIQH
ncbi:hypothetical protein WG936_09020 [Corynebacterium sp. H127]|uniref:hypothetical protein n=1 Tax=Corynebacterium sp. H127 TaxID=3133418 RepID=UPI00309B8A36